MKDGASRKADLGGDRAEARAAAAPDLEQAIAHLHTSHGDDERVRILTLEQHQSDLSK